MSDARIARASDPAGSVAFRNRSGAMSSPSLHRDIVRRRKVQPFLAAIMIGDRGHGGPRRRRDAACARALKAFRSEFGDRDFEESLLEHPSAMRSSFERTRQSQNVSLKRTKTRPIPLSLAYRSGRNRLTLRLRRRHGIGKFHPVIDRAVSQRQQIARVILVNAATATCFLAWGISPSRA